MSLASRQNLQTAAMIVLLLAPAMLALRGSDMADDSGFHLPSGPESAETVK